MDKNKTLFSFRVSSRGKDLLIALAEHHGVGMSAVLEMAIREKAGRELPAGAAPSPKPGELAGASALPEVDRPELPGLAESD